MLLPLVVTAADTAAVAGTPIYLDRGYSPGERAADLVERMTLDEKASQLVSSQSAAVPRLGVAAYGWWNEAAHGVAREQTNDGDQPPNLTNTTSYPVSLSLASSWDPELVRREASMISDEAREVVRDNRLDLDFYSPTVNLARDPRWGRNDETFGEDPFLTAVLGAQFVDGLQGPARDGYLKAVATLKHYAANNSESNRLNGSSDMDERTLREYYTAQFRDIIRWARPGSVMSSYNSVNGVPAAANTHLIGTLARQTYGFDGYFTSDCDAVFEMMAGQNWQPNGSGLLDQYSRTAYALSAGEDLNCTQGYHDDWNYANTVPGAVARSIRTQAGVFNEFDVDVSVARLFTARMALGEFDAESRVPWVAAARERLAANGGVTETPERLAMAREAATESLVLLKNRILPLQVPATGRYRVAVIGAFADPPELYLGGYSSVQTEAGVANSVTPFQGIEAAVKKANPGATVDFLAGTLPGDLDTVDPAAVKAAAGYDVAIVVAGTDRSTASEDHDRTTLALPGAQADLIRRVAKANPHTVAYLQTVGQVDVAPFADFTAAILWSSFNGQQQGAALADVLLGAANPSGKLPFTWYASESQLPPMEDYGIRPTATTPGRTYQYFTGTPTFPFGYGLSYTAFRYDALRVTNDGGTLTATATVTNTGRRAGAEVVQLYATTPDARPADERPRKRLVAFRKIELGPHESASVTLSAPIEALAFFAGEKFRVDPGRYGLELAASSQDVRRRATVEVTDIPEPTPSVVTAKPIVVGDAAKGITQRLRFPVGSRIDPQLTVALTDQSLVHPAEVRYESNRPSVVRVEGKTLRAVRPGVATVTATVGAARGTFVLVVSG
ncbi:glycoside hydrolase family 3 C-terminal domain-containing protein [Paractinoplanes durhamensis]|uniref:glycoside hydrolase family 3 C-terminal domain-containing protein n=1 Tax=Paractinoplanes durhamensis TaxID=113563 RepID=UPI001EF37DF3|nr:glycoside hydrolase family 3 C-terminal domain-containing protein [Actinoplanes durhamensis]